MQSEPAEVSPYNNFTVILYPQEPSEELIKLLGPIVATRTVSFSVPYIHLIMQYSACLLLSVLRISNGHKPKSIIYDCVDIEDSNKHLTLVASRHKITVTSNYDPQEVINRLIKYGKLNAIQFTP